MVGTSKTLLEDEKPSFYVEEEVFSGSFSSGLFKYRVY